MMQRFSFVLFSLVVMTFSSPAKAAASCPTPSAASSLPAPSLRQKIWVATRIYDTVTHYFAHWEGLPPDYNFDDHYKTFVDQALAAQTRIAFDLSAMRLFGSLANGHTSFSDSVLLCRDTVPFRAQHGPTGWIITQSRHPELTAGDIITAIDGRAFGEWAADQLPFLRGSNVIAGENHLFLYGLVWPVHFTLTLNNNRKVSINRDRIYPQTTHNLPQWPVETTTSALPHGGIRIVIPSFGAPQYEKTAIAALKAHDGASAILLDLRDNGGGSTPMSLVYALLERPTRDMLSATRLEIGNFEAWSRFGENPLPNAMIRNGGELIQPRNRVYHGPVYILINRHCVSACEDFVTLMHISHRAILLGETTEGSTGQPYQVDFPELEMRLRVSTIREYFPDGSPFEGVGVKPDIDIPLTREMLLDKGDAILDRAVAIMERTANAPSDTGHRP